MLSCLHRFDGDLDVPVIGGSDRDDVDIVAFENFAIVCVNIGLFYLSVFPFDADFVVQRLGNGEFEIEIAEGDDIA